MSGNGAIREKNKNLILNYLRNEGPSSRANISRDLKISKPAISRNVEELINSGIIYELGKDSNKLGKKATLIAVNEKKAYLVGVDIGNYKLRVGLAELTGRIIDVAEIPTNPSKNGIRIISDIDDLIVNLCEKNDCSERDIRYLCIGFPGIHDTVTKTNLLTPFIGDWEHVQIDEYFHNKYGINTIIENNVNLAAIGEYGIRLDENNVNIENLVYINLGVGIGAGVILNGKLVNGSNNAAGEIGFSRFSLRGINPGNNVSGEFEQCVSVNCWIPRYNKLVHDKNTLDTSQSSVETVFQRYEQGEEAATRIVNEILDSLSLLLINITALLNIQIVIIGGGLGNCISKYIPVLIERLKSNTPFPPNIEKAKGGALSGVYGAVRLCEQLISSDYRLLIEPVGTTQTK